MARNAEAAPETLRQRFGPVLKTFDHNLEQAREALAEGRHVAQEVLTEGRHVAQTAAEETVTQVRRHPLRAIAAAAAGGALVGCIFGFVAGWRAQRW